MTNESQPVAKSEDAPLAKLPEHQDEARPSEATELGFTIPKSILKPVSGRCIHCGYDCDEPDEQNPGEWIHAECHEDLVAQQQEDYRLDDPRHGGI